MVPRFGNRTAGKTLREQLQGIVHDYMQEHGVDEVDLDEVSAWAVKTGRYQRQPISIIKQCREQLSEACRSEVIKDTQGREARRMHAVRIHEGDRQMVFWADIKTAKPGHMRLSFQQRRQAILADCKAHKSDVAFYNDNNSFKVTLPLFNYNFNADLRELELPKSYPEDKPKS
jgi:hypothetical protein